MNDNYMKEVASLLGVELDEEFRVVDKDCVELCNMPCRITVNGLIDKKGESRFHALSKLLEGEYKIVKMPWKPKQKDIFYLVYPQDRDVTSMYWCDCLFDKLLYLSGNCFRTREEAEENIEAYCNYLETREPDLSWKNIQYS